MIELYFWPTSNNKKVTIMLHEVGLPYRLHLVNFIKGENYRDDFLALNPNAKTPTIVDDEGPGGKPITIFESGAILLYLAEKTGKFLGPDPRERIVQLQWLMWQMGGLGPMAGQNHHFNLYAPEKIPYAMKRYVDETNRLYGVLDRQLAGRPFVAGEAYSIADMAIYPWIVPHAAQGQNLDDFAHLKRWFEAVGARPATARAYAKGKEVRPSNAGFSEQEKKILFGQTANTGQ